MIAEVDVRAAFVLQRLRNGGKRMVYAISEAMRSTALEVQRAERQHVERTFTLRNKRDFILQQAAIITFPKPKEGLLEAKVAVGQKKNLLLPGFEKGFVREPHREGSTRVAVPEAARPTKTAPIPELLFIQRLRLRPHGQAIKGEQKTFAIRGVGIFQRLVADNAVLLYAFFRPFKVEPRLDFIETAHGVINRMFKSELAVRIYETLNYRR